ncbi:structure-specific endonuclease subunit SLX4 [Sabethes cyaneus]|uniref:structure-specific endonuclease subunit SLX4 n=1 Tax=Sabethes cyaneus TaxID=53552 RepID=UPI00237E82C4|nr:structure-specific endonuclease subunit SLX4 [Sabethes cyaneus]
MEQEIINLSDDSEDEEICSSKEPIIKRTRLDQPSTTKPLRLPKIPPDRGAGIVSRFFKATEDDFEPSQREPVQKAKTKVQRKSTAVRKPRVARKPKNQSDIRQVFQKYQNNEEQLLSNLMLEHTVADQLDPEQFQLAVAMSRSLTDQGGSSQPQPNADLSGEEAKASGSSSSISSEERRIQGIRATLEQYGFRCKTSYNDYDLNVIFGANSGVKNTRKGRWRRPTMLVRRDRESLVAFMKQKSEELLKEELNQPLAAVDDLDCSLRTYGSDVFWMSQNPEECEKGLENYYVESLVQVSSVKACYLLKNWALVPGREPSPNRHVQVEESTEIDIQPVEFEGYDLIEDPEDSRLDMNTVSEEYRQQYNNEVPVHVRTSKSPRRSVSPDLFASDSAGEEQETNAEVRPQSNTSKELVVPENVTEIEEQVSDEQFVTAIEPEDSGEADEVVLCTSSENIFDDSDPIVDYEVYTSDEAKITTAGPINSCSSRPSPPALEANPGSPTEVCKAVPDAVTVITLSSSENSNQNMDQPGDRDNNRNVTAADAVFPSPNKDLSFHALAIKDKLSRISFNDVETIDLEDDAEGTAETVAKTNLSSEASSASLCSNQDDPDDVLVISDDEVNYSIRHDYSAICNDSNQQDKLEEDNPTTSNQQVDPSKNEDLNSTKVYFNTDELSKHVSQPELNVEASCLISSDEEIVDTVKSKPAKADNTIAFLDNLIDKYNLPTNQTENCDKSHETGLYSYLEHYEIPDFASDDQSNEAAQLEPTAQKSPNAKQTENLDEEIEQILSQAKQTCTQLAGRRSTEEQNRGNPLKRTISDSALLEPRKKKATPTRKDSFHARFKSLTKEPEPGPGEFEIRLDNVSPRPDYDGMTSPVLHRELFRYGLKLLSRPKAVKMLNHIYAQLHPVVEIYRVDEEVMSQKRWEEISDRQQQQVTEVTEQDGSDSNGLMPFVPEMEGEEYILPVKPRKKTFWCAVPLNIAFYNMVAANRKLRQQILCYQPIDLDAVYGHLKEIGLRYETNDLIAFLDKRCITFRTAQGSGSRTKQKTS